MRRTIDLAIIQSQLCRAMIFGRLNASANSTQVASVPYIILHAKSPTVVRTLIRSPKSLERRNNVLSH